MPTVQLSSSGFVWSRWYLLPSWWWTGSHNISFATWLISLKSWLTSTEPPSYSFKASARASIVSMFKWLVGSSSKRRWGNLQTTPTKDDMTFLSITEVSHWHNLCLASKPKVANGSPHLFFFQSRVLAHHVFQCRHVQWQSLCKMLVVLSNLKVITLADHAI